MRLTKQQAEWVQQNEDVCSAIYKSGYEQGASMRWPEMVFWIALVMFLLNLAVGGE